MVDSARWNVSKVSFLSYSSFLSLFFFSSPLLMVNGMALLLVVVVVTQFLGSRVKRKKERKFR